MPATSEKIGEALHDVLGRFLEGELPRLKKELALSDRTSDDQIRAEREITVFLVFGLVQALVREVAEAGRQQAVLHSFFRAAAGEKGVKDFLGEVQGRFDEYEKAMKECAPAEKFFEGAILLHERLFPGQKKSQERLKVLADLYPRMDAACRKVLGVG